MFDQPFLKKILLEQNYITAEDAASADVDTLLQKGIIDRSTLGFAIGEYYKIAYSDLNARTPAEEELSRIPEGIARQYRIVFIKERKDEITVATDIPGTDGQLAIIQKIFPGKKISLSFAFKEDIDIILSHYQKALNTRFSEIIKKEKRVAPEIFDEIILDALSYRASDIHFEPDMLKTLVRFRIDGMLRVAGSIPREYYDNVLNRIKILSNLRTDEHYNPQDGAIRFAVKEHEVDLRVSIVPSLDGEKTVIRILTEYVRGLTFGELGFTDRHVALFDAASKKPFGMILVVGPTGSGKTTTLYALIKKMNIPEVNITTIEDPVEYRMAGATQIQVNQKTNLTFAKGLRAIVRQDPNVILVGEIRDTETAETAINAALTGHLLLSTFHANDAATSIPRLLEMAVEPFLLASTLELIVAQRLVRRICESCRYSYVQKVSELKELFPLVKDYLSGTEMTLYKGQGCSVCNHTGYKGRTSVIEMIPVTALLKEIINKRPTAAEIWSQAKKEGASSMFDDGLDKVKTGITTIDEVLRVATP